MSRDTVRWFKHRVAMERWKANNYQYYLEQKRRLAARPEYLARRRVMYALRKAARPNTQPENLSTTQSYLHELEETDEESDPRFHRRRSPTTRAQVGHRPDPAEWAVAEGAREPSRAAHPGGRPLLRTDGAGPTAPL